MADAPRPVEINGLVFASTSDGYLLEGEVRGHVEALQREIGELRARLQHVSSLERLAQATVMKADDLAVEIETEARRRVDELTEACETELVQRRRQFELETGAQQAAAQARVAQLQAALEGTLQTLGRALQAAGAPALEMPAASIPAWSPSAPAAPANNPALDGNGRDEVVDQSAGAAASAPEDEPYTQFGMPSAMPPVAEEAAAAEAAPLPAEAGFALEPGADDDKEAAIEPEPAVAVAEPERDEAASAERAEEEWAEAAPEPMAEIAVSEAPDADSTDDEDGARLISADDRIGSGTYELSRPTRAAPEPTPIRPTVVDRADDEVAATVPADPGPNTLSRVGPATLEIDMRPVKSFADLARVTKLLGRIAPGAQPVDLNLPQHRALFSVRGKDPQALAAQLQEALPDAKVVEREEGLDVLLEGGE
jgi:hypothetical protein